MNQLAQALWIVGSGAMLSLGSLHMLYTLFTDKLHSKDKSLNRAMNDARPVLTNRTDMWNSWIGFNASHSIGAIYFGGINSYLVIALPNLVLSNAVMIILNLAVAISYCLLAWRYWFNVPMIGSIVCLVCFLLSLTLHQIN